MTFDHQLKSLACLLIYMEKTTNALKHCNHCKMKGKNVFTLYYSR